MSQSLGVEVADGVGSKGRFPFGQPSTVRPPRIATPSCKAFVLGVYPSALHVRWSLPDWARHRFSHHSAAVGALAVDVEPQVFWDGSDAEAEVLRWKHAIGWVDGNSPGQYGYARAAMNGTSGVAVRDQVLAPLGLSPLQTSFSDLIPWFFVKRSSSSSRRGQANVIEEIYAPIASVLELPAASLPPRPSPGQLVGMAISNEAGRLREEIAASGARLLITLGEEARKTVEGLAAHTGGPPSRPLQVGDDYGRLGRAVFDACELAWLALTHPGNRSPRWRLTTEQWAAATAQEFDL